MTAIAFLAQLMTINWQLISTTAIIGQLWSLIRPSKTTEQVWRGLARVHQELWLFAPPGLLLSTVRAWHSDRPWLIALYAWALLTWWGMRNWPEDNHWKRRAKKAKDAVARRGARLVVVPAGAAS